MLCLKSAVYVLFTFILLRQMLHLLIAVQNMEHIYLKSKAIILNKKRH